jgi:hypothetical protein
VADAPAQITDEEVAIDTLGETLTVIVFVATAVQPPEFVPVTE